MSVAHNYEAARQLHADLMALPNFRGLMFPELFDNVSKSISELYVTLKSQLLVQQQKKENGLKDQVRN